MFDYCLFVFLAKTPVYSSSSLSPSYSRAWLLVDRLQCLCLQLLQACLSLCNPMDCSPPDSSVHGIFRARILDWFAISFSRGSSQPKDGTSLSCVSCISRQILHCWAIRETPSWQSAHSLMNSLAVHPGMPEAGLQGPFMGVRTSHEWRLTYPLVHWGLKSSG